MVVSTCLNIVRGGVASGVVCGDLRSPRTTSLETTLPSTIFYRLLRNRASLGRHYERSLRMALHCHPQGFSRIYERNARFKKQNPQHKILPGTVARRNLIPALKG
jgi:hypothetical protein